MGEGGRGGGGGGEGFFALKTKFTKHGKISYLLTVPYQQKSKHGK